MEKYEINKETVAIIGINEKFTKIMEKDNDYFISDIAYEVMDYSCQYFGSSYEGRVDGSRKMLGANYKLPVIVEESNDLIFFPISAADNPKCIWISLKWFDCVVKEENETKIYLKNGKNITTDISKNSIDNQVMRASRLALILNERKNC